MATFWHLVPETGSEPTSTDLGRLLKQLHALPAPDFPLPSWEPFERIRSRIADAEGLDEADCGFLVERTDRLEIEVQGLEFELPAGVIHDDPFLGNLIPGEEGPVICDFDSLSHGPREWDLVPAAVGEVRMDYPTDPHTPIRAITLDLDDTLWPVWPTIERAERRVHAWLEEHAPRTAAAYDAPGLRRLRFEVESLHPELSHDLSGLRRESLRLALTRTGEDGGLAEPAFELFLEERNRVELFDDVMPSLERLAARYPLVALTNGNADLGRIGLEHLFVCKISARDVGAPKPDPRMFVEASGRLGLPPADILHVGDDVERDVRAALSAGLGAAWVVRPEIHPEPGPAPEGTGFVVRELNELAARLVP